jgi:hypothetical protein
LEWTAGIAGAAREFFDSETDIPVGSDRLASPECDEREEDQWGLPCHQWLDPARLI